MAKKYIGNNYVMNAEKSFLPICYLCSSESPFTLSTENSTREHILINALGGRLQSNRLICRACNSTFGKNIDAALANQLAPLANLLNVKRDHGHIPVVRAILKNTGEEILLKPGGKPEPKQIAPELTAIDEHTLNLKLTSPNRKIARKQLKELKRKYPKLELEKLLESEELESTGPYPEIRFKVSLGGRDVRRSVCKSIVNFYIMKGGKPDWIQAHIPFIQGANAGPDQIGFFYPTISLYSLGQEQITHGISVVGCPERGLLFGYLEYFNVLSYLILLNDQYIGDGFQSSYIYDLVGRTELTETPDFTSYTRDAILTICGRTALEPTDIEDIRVAGEKFISKHAHIQRSEHIKTIAHEVFSELKDGDTLTRDHIEHFHNRLMNELVIPLLQRTAQMKSESGGLPFDR